MSNITGKYLVKIKKDLIEYSDIILEFVFDAPSKYKPMTKAVIKNYVEKYYYEPETEFTVLEEYFPDYKKMNLILRYILWSIYEYHSEEKTLKELKKNNNFYLIIGLIIWISNETNKLINPLEEKIQSKEITNEIIDLIQKILPFTKENSLILINDNLNEKIKENHKSNHLFFELMKNNKIYNEFSHIDKEDKYYAVNYKYEIEDIEKYQKNEVEEIIMNKGITDKLINISLELLTLTIIKMQFQNKLETFLYPISLDYYKQPKNIEFLNKLTSIKPIKENIVFLINYEEYMANRNFIGEIKMAGFTIALDDPPAIEYKNYNIFADSKIVIVDDKFLEINKHFVSVWQEKGIELIKRKDKLEVIYEEDLLI